MDSRASMSGGVRRRFLEREEPNVEAWHYHYPGSFWHRVSEWRKTFKMALSVPKTMFQHMLKEGAKVCYEVQCAAAKWFVVAVNLCQKLPKQISFMGIFDKLTQLTSPVHGHVRYNLSKLYLVKNGTCTFFDCVRLKEVEIAWFVKLDTKISVKIVKDLL